MTYRSIAAETWLASTILDLPSVVSTFGNRVLTEEIQNPAGVATPYLIVARHPSVEVARPLGQRPTAEAFAYDIVGYASGHTTDGIKTAMNDIDTALVNEDNVEQDGYCIVVADNGELPPAPPPRMGETPTVRLGKQYAVSVIGS